MTRQRTRRRTLPPAFGVAAGLVLAAASCAEPALALEDQPCPSDGTELTYGNFGAGFFADHCNRCHSTGAAGAPTGYRFDRVEDIRRQAARIFVRAAGPNTTMPPGPDDPPEDDRDRLATWLACGAP